MYLPRTLSLITTHQCTAACDNCCFGCSPTITNAVPVDNLHKYIDQAKEIPSLKVIVFTGGECFLLGKNLDKLIRRASENGFMTRFVSNGYWATSLESARNRVDSLVEAGLTEANFSTGDNHLEFVPLKRVMFGAIACAEAGITTMVVVEAFKGAAFSSADLFDDPRFRELCDEGKIMVKTSPWMKFNGKKNPEYSEEYRETVKSCNSRCTTVYDVVAINPDEYLMACCGLTMEETPDLRIGSLKERTIKEILDEANEKVDLEKIWISMRGPYEMVKIGSGGEDTSHSAAHACEACRHYYKNPEYRAKFMEFANSEEGEGMIKKFILHNLIKASGEQDSGNGRSQIVPRNLALLKKGCTLTNVNKILNMV